MADLSNTSFIPKQNPAKVKHQSITRQVYFFNFISVVLIIAALIASAAVFFYQRHTKNTLADEITGLNTDVASFGQSDMDMVSELDQRLVATEKVVASNISMPAILAILELSTISSMQFLETTIARGDTNTIVLKAKILTDSFDSVLFQREVFNRAESLVGVDLTDVKITLPNSSLQSTGEKLPMSVDLSATFMIPEGGVLYKPMFLAPQSIEPAAMPSFSPTSSTAVSPYPSTITPDIPVDTP